MDIVLKKLFDAADAHGEDSGEPDHTVGDLQGLLRKAWSLMSKKQKLEFLASDEVEELVDMGARGDFDVPALVRAVSE